MRPRTGGRRQGRDLADAALIADGFSQQGRLCPRVPAEPAARLLRSRRLRREERRRNASSPRRSVPRRPPRGASSLARGTVNWW
jgi:hypothetical protein